MRLRRGFAFDFDFDLGELEGYPLEKTAGACANVALDLDPPWQLTRWMRTSECQDGTQD